MSNCYFVDLLRGLNGSSPFFALVQNKLILVLYVLVLLILVVGQGGGDRIYLGLRILFGASAITLLESLFGWLLVREMGFSRQRDRVIIGQLLQFCGRHILRFMEM